MRTATVVVAIVAGTAVRLLLNALPPFRRRRRLRRRPQAAPPPQHPHESAPKRARHPDVLALLDKRAPVVRADHWRRAHPEVECTFCLDTIRPSRAALRVTRCGHAFHAHCLEQWVVYTADACLDWHHYSLADDGSIESHVRHPSCPNCSADLDVMPAHLLRNVMLTSVARSLSLRDLSAAAEMYDAGLVYRAAPAHPHHPAPATPTRSPPRYVRQDSTVSEPASTPPASVRDTPRRPRRSLPEEMAPLVRPPVLTRAEQRGWRRAFSQTGINPDLSTAQVVLQASS